MLGLLFDTLVVRSFMTPAIAALLGRWFWWPRRVHTHAAPQPAASTPAGGPPKEDAATTAPLGLNATSPEEQQ
jgi:RND superfamily putative drug exporter